MSRRGIVMSVKGRLNGVRRARGMREMEGGVSGNSLCKKHKSSSREISTK
jgi:ribosomal protein S3